MTEDYSSRQMLSPREVANAIGCDPKTVTRWARQGKIKSIKTPGGHRRYSLDDVEKLLNNSGEDNPEN